MTLKNKKILFFALNFFGYEREIKKKLEEFGAIVDYYDERPSNSFWAKATIRFNDKLLYFQIAKYYNKIGHEIKNKRYDYVFIVNMESMPRTFLSKLRKKQAEARFILYMWDSFSNRNYIVNSLQYFDEVYSFDKEDCEKYSMVKFRPLFYLDEYKEIGFADNINCKYDFSFVGTAHSDRYSFLKKIQTQLNAIGANTYWYLYLQSRMLYFWNKMTNSNFCNSQADDFKYCTMPKEELMHIIEQSRIVIDIAHPKQTGLTMRTIEMLGAKRKLITTNEQIRNYDFYRPENILVVDRNNPVISRDFIQEAYKPIAENIYEKYSIGSWINEILIY